MDKIVAKAVSSDAPRSITPNSTLSSTKPCRYGDNCSRPGCRFRHSFDNVTPQAPTNNPYCSNNWLPHKICMSLKGEELAITKIDNDVRPFLN